jgi:para-nitrobenzyl esterase
MLCCSIAALLLFFSLLSPLAQFNYRLGPLGFLALKAAKHEDPLGRVGSYGIYDQVFFLQWVQRNIGAFGGDPRQVTIAGESAGAFSTCIHLTSPLSRGLFRAAIMESGTCSSASFFQAQEAGMAWADTFVKTVGCDPSLPDAQMMNCVRKANLTTIMGPDMTRNNTNAGSFMPLLFPMMPWGATIDGVLMRDVPFNVLQSGMGNPVDAVLMGSNLDEGSIFLGRMATVVPQIHTPVQFGDLDVLVDHFFNGNATVRALVNKAYPPSNYGNATDQIEKMMRDFFFLCPTSRAALALTASGVPTFVYQFVYHTEWIENFLGVYHSAELEFVFANEWPPIVHTFSPRDHVMAKTFGYYWQNVVKYGDPNGVKKADGEQLETEAFWPRYIAKSKQSMALDVPSSVVSGLQEDKCRMWDLVAPWTPPAPHARVAAEAAGMFKRARRAAKIALE